MLLNSEGLVGLISPEVPLLAMWMATFLLCPYMSFHLYMNTPGVSLCVLISSYKDISYIGLGSTQRTSFYLNYQQWQTLFSWATKSLQMVTAAMKLKDSSSLGEKL